MRYKWCKPCEISWLKENFTKWTSENEQIDNLIKKMQLGISDHKDLIFEWIPYYQFNDIKELSHTAYSARWKNGPLLYNCYFKNEYTRNSTNKAVILKYLVDSQNISDEFLNEIIIYYNKVKLYGISQIPNTKDYIIVFDEYKYLENCCIRCEKYLTNADYKCCRPCQIDWLKENFTNWTSGNEQIDNLIQKIQLGINDCKDVIFEWIPYHQFNNTEELLSNKTYSAIWKDGPLMYDHTYKSEYIRNSENKSVILKNLLADSQNITDGFLNKIVAHYKEFQIYGISQNSSTKDYIIVLNQDQYFKIVCNKCANKYVNAEYEWCKLCQKSYLKNNFTNWTSKNKQIDKLIQKMQLKINDYDDTIFEWIPYNQFNDIKELSNTTHSARWKDGPLLYDYHSKNENIRNSANKAVIIKYLFCFQNITNELLNKIIAYYNKFQIYGISQNPSTKNNYIIVLNQDKYFKIFCDKCGNKYANMEYKWCKVCQKNYLKENFASWTSNSEQIDKLIQEMQLKINDYKDIIFEWIPYYQFNDIKEIGKGGFAKVYSAKWRNGLLYWDKKEYKRDLNKIVALKCLNNSQNISNKFLNEVKAYSINDFNNFDNSGEILKIYGISQNPNTKDYVMVLQYARGGNFNNWLNNNCKNFNWPNKLKVLNNIINGLNEIHQKRMVHRDLHTGNILFKDTYYWATSNYISDMGSCSIADIPILSQF
ncbi:hypothetical protein RirG_125150 [Rhizophagus irregularis DAOM 197198w]|uniref:Protein kinase domain-containing protein n=2 Tax=Rhizophagus irregularis TaxID=588596 RepID=A0A015KFS5_RHIIW|nr:hypothetical protein RirG_125150 [Rhizophagus irregularis DAOM 197198w]